MLIQLAVLFDLRVGFPMMYFYRANICEGGLGSRNSVRLSVRPSVRLSVTRVDCDKTK